ncbi:MAG: hypothetical protein EON93_07365, partial [Burkholderiales bacterium]
CLIGLYRSITARAFCNLRVFRDSLRVGVSEWAGVRTLVTIRCGERLCALDRAAVREVTPLPDLSRPPSLPASVEGLMNLAGEAVLVVDLVRLLDISPNKEIDPIYRHVVVLQQQDGSTGLLVDRVEDVASVADDAIVAADRNTTINDCVVGQVDIGGETAHVLDAGRIFLSAERVRLADMQRSEQARLDALDA